MNLPLSTVDREHGSVTIAQLDGGWWAARCACGVALGARRTYPDACVLFTDHHHRLAAAVHAAELRKDRTR